jgi:hypothetical protein
MTGLDRTVGALRGRQRTVWLLALLAYGVGDLATTVVGLSFGRAAEAGPLAAESLARGGFPGLVALKLATLLGFYLLWRVASTPGRVAIPLALAVVGVGVTLWNLSVLW